MDLTSLITSIFLLLLLNTHLPTVASASCPVSRCNDSEHLVIRFPFRFNNSEHPTTCGYPGFDVTCDPNSNRTFLELQGTGNLFINNIDYSAQAIWVNDPNNCLPQKLLSLNLSNSPFSGIYLQDFVFYNCSNTINNNNSNKNTIVGPIKCLSSTDYLVYATPLSTGSIVPNVTCNLTSPPKMVQVPVQRPSRSHNSTFSIRSELDEDLRLTWFMPECQPCERDGHMCALERQSNGSLITVCNSNIPTTNGKKIAKLPSATVIAISIVICLPSVLCVLASVWIWLQAWHRKRSTRMVQQNPSDITHSPPSPAHLEELGLEELNIEFARQVALLGLRVESDPEYQPNIVFSEIEETSVEPSTMEGDDNSCAICMGEYEVNDKIGSLPTCGHYFHAYCITTWLTQSPRIIGSTCPICRARVVGDSL